MFRPRRTRTGDLRPPRLGSCPETTSRIGRPQFTCPGTSSRWTASLSSLQAHTGRPPGQDEEPEKQEQRPEGVADDDVEALVGDLLHDVPGELGEVAQAGRGSGALPVAGQVEGEDLPAEVGEVLLHRHHVSAEASTPSRRRAERARVTAGDGNERGRRAVVLRS